VATLAGVSVSAVSQVFNQRGNISDATADRIREAARKLNWTPSPAAVALREARARSVGLVLNHTTDNFEAGGSRVRLIYGLESVLAPRDYGLSLYMFDRTAEDEARFYRRLAAARRVDGVILTDSMVGDVRFDLMRSLELPAVLVGAPWRSDPIPSLDSETAPDGIHESVEHLVQQGHSRIAYIGGPADRVQPTHRRRSFEAAMREFGLTPVANLDAGYNWDVAAEQTTELLEQLDPPTAIMYASDEMALTGMRAARRAGFTVPEDLSVIGYDGVFVGAWTDPELTSVHRDSVQRGRVAAALLLRALGEEVEEQYELTPPKLVVRGSTAPPRTE
jgi:DNA-binding LacI/PurR family transcriptional regulator